MNFSLLNLHRLFLASAVTLLVWGTPCRAELDFEWGALQPQLRSLMSYITPNSARGILPFAPERDPSRELERPSGSLLPLPLGKMHVHCVGNYRRGEPLVLFINGLGRGLTDWLKVMSRISPTRAACAYDPYGFHLSQDRPGWEPRNPRANAMELDQLVNALGLPGPFILVAHSYGANVARWYTKLQPRKVWGVVFVDGGGDLEGKKQMGTRLAMRYCISSYAQWNLCKRVLAELSKFTSQVKVPSVEGARLIAAHDSYDMRSAGNLGIRPLIVITSTKTEQTRALWRESQLGLLSLSVHSRRQQWKTSVGHLVAVENPAIVEQAIDYIYRELGY